METSSATRLSAGTRMGAVRLAVQDLDRARQFYAQALGLNAGELPDGGVVLSAGGGALVELLPAPPGAARVPRAPGLFHLAILLPSRVDLALSLARLAQARWPLDGASDHLVSEALYLSDPEGNGIELYRDRPRAQWRYENGELAMATLPLDLDDLLSELAGADQIPASVPGDTAMGHVHLQVGDLRAAGAFYTEVLGFEATVSGYPGALFVSAGGYHHHLGLNTWRSAGSPPRPPGALGLEWYEVLLDGEAELAAVTERLRAAGAPLRTHGDGLLAQDPAGNWILLRSRS